MEGLDIYAGWAPSWKGIDFDLGYLRYQYPNTNTSENNTDEFHLGISYDVKGYFTPSYTAYYSDDWFGTGSAWYHDVSVEVPLPYDFTLARSLRLEPLRRQLRQLRGLQRRHLERVRGLRFRSELELLRRRRLLRARSVRG